MAVSTIATAFFLLASGGQAAPQLKGGASQECRDTLAVARSAFYSKSFFINDATALPKGPVEIVAQRGGGNISEDGDITADATAFKKLSGAPDQSSRYQYWQISPPRTLRWVIEDEAGGWRGDSYSLYAVDAKTDELAFARTVDKMPAPIIDQSWLPPLMLRDTRTQAIWAVDTGPYSGVLNDWTVFAERDGTVTKRCTIVFSPVKDETKLLPAPTRRLARLLDGTLGEGRDEGTLHPTYRIRSEVADAWANAALRPWAVTLKPYHSRRNADLGLRNWSHGAKSFRVLYRQIQAQYPLAEQALADLYVQKFGQTPDQAKALAARNLDLIYRDHFVFSQDDLHPNKTP